MTSTLPTPPVKRRGGVSSVTDRVTASSSSRPTHVHTHTAEFSAWRESANARDARMNELLAETRHAQDKINAQGKGMLDALRDLAAERRTELECLSGELRLLEERVARTGGAHDELASTRDELQAQCALAAEEAAAAEANGATLAYMEERLYGRRPHLVRKLHFMRSQAIEMRERLQVALEARECALTSEERWAVRLGAEHERVAALIADNNEQRAVQKAKLEQSGSVRRKAQLDLTADGRPLTQVQLAQLGEVVSDDNAALEAATSATSNAAAKKADETYDAAVTQADAAARPFATAARLARAEKEEDKGVVTKREAWRKISTWTEQESLGGVLAYLEDKQTTFATLKGAEEDRLFRIQWDKDKYARLQLDLSAARDAVDAARAVFDEKLDEVSAARASTRVDVC